MTDPLTPQLCAEKLSALAAPERLLIVRFLSGGPHNVTEIAEHLGIALVNISHHLNVLRHANIIRGEKQGRFVVYSLQPGLLLPETAGSPSERLDLGCCKLELPLDPPAVRKQK